MKSYVLVFALPMLVACTGPRQSASIHPSASLVIDGKVWSSAFQQRAAEYKALCIQSFNIARWRVDEILQQNSSKPRAIITDIDETFLDNSPYSVHQALKGKDYEPSTWADWTNKGEADTLVGSFTFFSYAASRGVEIFYITNREEKERQGTVQNLQRFHFPFADDAHLVMRKDESSKEARRLRVAERFDIILLLGDNLADFSSLFDKKDESQRAINVISNSNEFGKRFIILPNANYGGWEDAIYLNQRNWTGVQKDSLIRSKLIDYK